MTSQVISNGFILNPHAVWRFPYGKGIRFAVGRDVKEGTGRRGVAPLRVGGKGGFASREAGIWRKSCGGTQGPALHFLFDAGGSRHALHFLFDAGGSRLALHFLFDAGGSRHSLQDNACGAIGSAARSREGTEPLPYSIYSGFITWPKEKASLSVSIKSDLSF